MSLSSFHFIFHSDTLNLKVTEEIKMNLERLYLNNGCSKYTSD